MLPFSPTKCFWSTFFPLLPVVGRPHLLWCLNVMVRAMNFSSRSFTLRAASLAEVSDSILDLESRYVSVSLNLRVHRPFNLDGQNLIISMVCAYILLVERSELQFIIFFPDSSTTVMRLEAMHLHKNRSLCQVPARSHMI